MKDPNHSNQDHPGGASESAASGRSPGAKPPAPDAADSGQGNRKCCDHDHDHQHSHEKHDSCCGHDHGKNHDSANFCDAGHGCGHPRGDECTHEHAGGSSCCGHDHNPHPHADSAEDVDWSRRFFLFAELIVLLLWAVILLYFYASGRVGHFLAPQFQLLSLLGGLGVAFLGIYNWAMRATGSACGHGECDHNHDHDHDHSHAESEAGGHHHHHEPGFMGRAFGLLMLAIPAAAAATLSPDEFSPQYILQRVHNAQNSNVQSTASTRKRLGVADATKAMGGYTLEAFSKNTTRNARGEYELQVDILQDLAYDPEVRNVVKGIPVETTGMVTTDKVNNPKGTRLRAVIMVSSCCAADGRPYSIPLEFDAPPPAIADMTWYKVTGKLEFGTERGNPTTILREPKLTPTTRPPLFRMYQ